MLELLLASAALFPASVQEEDPAAKRAVIERAVRELEKAARSREPTERSAAIGRNGTTADPEVVRLVAKGVKDRDPRVQDAALEALRYNPAPEALETLHHIYRRDKQLRRHYELYPKLIKAIGQHGDASSVEVLARNAIESDRRVTQARVFALANIRDCAAVDALFKLMRSGGRERVQLYMPDLRLALMSLTSQDLGSSQDAWMEWWGKHRKDFVVAAQAPRLPKAEQQRWEYFWGLRRTYERTEKRGERGNDPER